VIAPSLDPAQSEATCTELPFLFIKDLMSRYKISHDRTPPCLKRRQGGEKLNIQDADNMWISKGRRVTTPLNTG
jgi:hypothetical protein